MLRKILMGPVSGAHLGHQNVSRIIAGYLRSQFAQDKRLSLAVSICFERSYSGVDGNSANSIKIYALASAVSGLLREGVLEAVATGKLHIWPVAKVEHGFKPLTGCTAGQKKRRRKIRTRNRACPDR